MYSWSKIFFGHSGNYYVEKRVLLITLSFSLLCLQPESQVHVHWKGATETVLASCAWYIDATDQLVTLDEDKV